MLKKFKIKLNGKSNQIKKLENEVSLLKDSLQKLKDTNNDLDERIDRLNRIYSNSKDGRITWRAKNYESGYVLYSIFNSWYNTYIYKDKEEYLIKGLKLSDPSFTETEVPNILKVTDKHDDKETVYYVNLKKCSYEYANVTIE